MEFVEQIIKKEIELGHPTLFTMITDDNKKWLIHTNLNEDELSDFLITLVTHLPSFKEAIFKAAKVILEHENDKY